MIFKCARCGDYIVVDSINCGVLRHAYHKSNYKQVDPHISKDKLDALEVYGCKAALAVYEDGRCIEVPFSVESNAKVETITPPLK